MSPVYLLNLYIIINQINERNKMTGQLKENINDLEYIKVVVTNDMFDGLESYLYEYDGLNKLIDDYVDQLFDMDLDDVTGTLDDIDEYIITGRGYSQDDSDLVHKLYVRTRTGEKLEYKEIKSLKDWCNQLIQYR